MTANKATAALIFGLLAAFFWGTHSVIVRFLTADIHGMPIAALRLYIAAAALFVILRLQGHKVSLPLRDTAFWVTVLGTVANYIFFHIGLEHTGAANAMMLENTAPFFVVLFMLTVLGERVRTVEIAATGIAIFGIYFIVRNDLTLGGEGLEGDLLELAAGATWGVFLLGSCKALERAQSTAERLNFLFAVFIVSAALLTPAALFFPFVPNAEDLVFLVLLGLLPTAVAYYLWYEAAARVSPVTASLLFTLSIIFTFANAYLFLGETLSIDMFIGAALIIGAVVLSKLTARDG